MDLINVLLQEALEIKQINSADVVLAAGNYPASGSYIDTRGLHRFAFIVMPGTTANAQTWQVKQATTVSGTLKDVTGAVLAIAANDDGKPHIVEVDVAELDINNGYRYVTLTNASGTTGDYASVLWLAVGKRVPVTQDANFGDKVAVVG